MSQPSPTRIASVFQEILTVIVRIRAGRHQAPDAAAFRQQVRGMLVAAQENATRLNYTREEALLGAQAAVAFLDESILKSQNQLLHEWIRQPIGPDYFHQHVAGIVYFENIRNLLTGDNSPRTADLLELYQTCLLLGYRGRFGDNHDGDVRAICDRIAEKVQRIHGGRVLLAPNWRPATDTLPAPPNVWSRRLTWAAGIAAGLLAVGLLLYWLLLRNDLSSVSTALVGGAR